MTAPKITLTAAAAAAATLALLAVLAPSPAHGAASAWSVNDPSQVRLITAAKVTPRTGEMWMGLQFRLKPGWHVYWKNSGDAGYPPAVTFQPADVLGKPEIQWPAPQRFDLPGGLVAFGYEKEVIYPIRARLQPAAAPTPGPTPAPTPASQSPDTLKITADLDYLVCQADCIPFRYTLTLDQPLGFPTLPDPEAAPLLKDAVERLPKTATEMAGVTTEVSLDTSPATGPDLEIRVRGAKAEAGKTDVFLETNEALEAGRPRVKVVSDGVVFHVAMKPKDTSKPLPAHTPIAWTVTHLAANGHPFSLEARRDVEVATGVGGPPAGPPGAPQPPVSRERLAHLLLSAFLGGALLNLMPPVFALLLAELFALRAGERGRVREGAAAAATGIVGAAWLVALLAVAAVRAGLPAGWGVQLQEPVLAAFLAVLSALMALNLWGVVEVPLPSGASATSSTSRHLLAGLFATPLALAWPLPQLQEPLGYALGRGPATVTAVVAVVGFGLALPYLILAVVPVLVRALPTPGTWLPRLREGLGFLAGTGAFWVLYALSRQVSAEGIAFIELALLAMSLLAWLRHREGRGRTFRAVLAVGLLACAAGALWLADHNRLVPRARSAAAPLSTP